MHKNRHDFALLHPLFWMECLTLSPRSPISNSVIRNVSKIIKCHVKHTWKYSKCTADLKKFSKMEPWKWNENNTIRILSSCFFMKSWMMIKNCVASLPCFAALRFNAETGKEGWHFAIRLCDKSYKRHNAHFAKHYLSHITVSHLT